MNKLTYVLNVLCKESAPGKKTVQKLIYLAERKGLDLGCDFSIHFYGPYSSDLDGYLHAMEANNIISIDTSGMTHRIKVQKRIRSNPLTKRESEILSQIIDVFSKKSPLELEVLTTTDYVINNMVEGYDKTGDEVVAVVKRIKGVKFSEQQIRSSIKTLKRTGFILM